MIESSPALGSDGIVYVGSDEDAFSGGNNLFAFYPTGSLSWSYTTAGWVRSSPAIAPDGRLYFSAHSSALLPMMYALTPTGTLSWSYRPANIYNEISSPSSGPDGEFYAGSAGNRLYALLSNGSLSWSYGTFGPVIYSCPAIGTDRRLYFGSADNALYAITSAPSLAWSYITGNPIFSSPAIGDDGALYVSSTDNNFYALSSTGRLAWSYTSTDRVDQSPAIGADGSIYVGSGDNRLYAFEGPPTPTPTSTPTSTPAATPTPNYVELSVRQNGEGGDDFYPGDTVVLDWQAFPDRYGYAGVPCAIYLAAAMNPPADDAAMTVEELLRGKPIYLFDSTMRAHLYNPRDVKPTFARVIFPVPGIGTSGELTFKVPRGAAGRWAFAAAFIRLDNRQYPAQPPVEVSNGFTMH